MQLCRFLFSKLNQQLFFAVYNLTDIDQIFYSHRLNSMQMTKITVLVINFVDESPYTFCKLAECMSKNLYRRMFVKGKFAIMTR